MKLIMKYVEVFLSNPTTMEILFLMLVLFTVIFIYSRLNADTGISERVPLTLSICVSVYLALALSWPLHLRELDIYTKFIKDHSEFIFYLNILAVLLLIYTMIITILYLSISIWFWILELTRKKG